MSTYRLAARLDDLWNGEMRSVRLEGRHVLLVRVDGEVHAYEDRCAHLGLPLSEGRLAGCVLTCAAHEWQYDACTGHGINPRNAALRRFPVRIEAGAIWVAVDAPEGGRHGRGAG